MRALIAGIALALLFSCRPLCAQVTNDLHQLEAQAAAGDGVAMTTLGKMYEEGTGVRMDYEQARRWYEKAASAGDGDGMSRLGLMYGKGRGVRQDMVEAFRWYLKGAEAGSSKAMYNVGASYHLGQGVRIDYEQARRWYEKALSASDHPSAMYNLGVLYSNGYGVRRDLAEAVRWYKKAAALGHEKAGEELAKYTGRSSGTTSTGGYRQQQPGGSYSGSPMKGPAYCGQRPAGTPGC